MLLVISLVAPSIMYRIRNPSSESVIEAAVIDLWFLVFHSTLSFVIRIVSFGSYCFAAFTSIYLGKNKNIKEYCIFSVRIVVFVACCSFFVRTNIKACAGKVSWLDLVTCQLWDCVTYQFPTHHLSFIHLMSTMTISMTGTISITVSILIVFVICFSPSIVFIVVFNSILMWSSLEITHC